MQSLEFLDLVYSVVSPVVHFWHVGYPNVLLPPAEYQPLMQGWQMGLLLFLKP